MDTVWVPYGILFQEFHDYNPKVVETSSELFQEFFHLDSFLKLLWTIATFLLMASYGSNLRSQLIIQEYGETLENLDQLLNE